MMKFTKYQMLAIAMITVLAATSTAQARNYVESGSRGPALDPGFAFLYELTSILRQ